MSSYGYGKVMKGDFKQIVQRATDELAKEGFGVLATFDLKEKFKEKLGIESDEYVILGACNPKQAHRALQTEQELGLLLPCNVIVYRKDKDIVVSAMRPTVAMGFIRNRKLDEIAGEVEESLKRVIDRL